MNLLQEDSHCRTIIHIDMDCFYAQVEMIKNPQLVNVPFGVYQKNIVVTSNYIAREYGIKKCMLISDAQKLCSNLVLVKGEDLHDYRQLSYKVTTHLQSYSRLVERLGLDENFVDVTQLVSEKLNSEDTVLGHIFGDNLEYCECGCKKRLTIGSRIAQDIRDSINKEFKLTCCAGVAHNKLMAKLVGATHKPNQQTIIFPNNAMDLVSSLNELSSIPGIGKSICECLGSIGIKSIEDMQNSTPDKLKTLFPPDKAKYLYNLSYGVDEAPVKATGKPQVIGLEDACRPMTVEREIKDKIEQLLKRLMILLNEDGRVPRTIKLVVRKFDKSSKMSHRETKQCNVNQSIFSGVNGKMLPEASEKRLVKVIMDLFIRIVDIKKPYHITLLGLSFTKFLERATGKHSIAAFLKKDLEVQAITSIENMKDLSQSTGMDLSNSSTDLNTDGSESELEPSPKKKKLSTFIARRYLNTDCPSPSKLNVAELRINCEKISDDSFHCPPNADIEVFRELPKDMQRELWQNYVRERDREERLQVKKPRLNTLLNYFVKN
ncbi:PREDICTED: DNA polymerase iota [Nicrophorus vespilloides]|uniref:DNA polymerase iota n=1 Tax=Nicrophorus vespilloides TaxID=110193 RepID=A0ABM1NB60_NICVS|nr:PREDICTED: DNA polymerase iota [Nicrophorus vespilloides]